MQRPLTSVIVSLSAAAALVTGLAACSPSAQPQAAVTVTKTAAPSATQGPTPPPPTASTASSAPSVTGSSAASSSAAAKPVTVEWSRIVRGDPNGSDYYEDLLAPYLKNAPETVSNAFNLEVSRQVAGARAIARPSSGKKCYTAGACSLRMDKISGGVYRGRYASAMSGLHPWGGGAHPMGMPAGLTVDLQTGESVGLDTFVTASDTQVSAYVRRALEQKLPQQEIQGDWPSAGIHDDGVAWSVSDRGVTFAFTQGSIASESQGILSVTVPWKVAQA